MSTLAVVQRLAAWQADALVAIAVMRSLGRGERVVLSAATVLESYTEGPDGLAAGGESRYSRCLITAKYRGGGVMPVLK